MTITIIDSSNRICYRSVTTLSILVAVIAALFLLDALSTLTITANAIVDAAILDNTDNNNNNNNINSQSGVMVGENDSDDNSIAIELNTLGPLQIPPPSAHNSSASFFHSSMATDDDDDRFPPLLTSPPSSLSRYFSYSTYLYYSTLVRQRLFTIKSGNYLMPSYHLLQEVSNDQRLLSVYATSETEYTKMMKGDNWMYANMISVTNSYEPYFNPRRTFNASFDIVFFLLTQTYATSRQYSYHWVYGDARAIFNEGDNRCMACSPSFGLCHSLNSSSPIECRCKIGYGGPNCTEPLCEYPSCGLNSHCIGSNNCQCNHPQQYRARYQCITTNASRVTDPLCSSGSYSWSTSFDCSYPLCPRCENGGYCNDYGRCNCNNGYNPATNCSTLNCQSSCSGHDICTVNGCVCPPDNCKCLNCERSPYPCFNGTDKCKCIGNWNPLTNCETAICTPPCKPPNICTITGCVCPHCMKNRNCPNCYPYRSKCIEGTNQCPCIDKWDPSTNCSTPLCTPACQGRRVCTIDGCRCPHCNCPNCVRNECGPNDQCVCEWPFIDPSTGCVTRSCPSGICPNTDNSFSNVCVNGICQCIDGYTGPYCSQKVQPSSGSIIGKSLIFSILYSVIIIGVAWFVLRGVDRSSLSNFSWHIPDLICTIISICNVFAMQVVADVGGDEVYIFLICFLPYAICVFYRYHQSKNYLRLEYRMSVSQLQSYLNDLYDCKPIILFHVACYHYITVWRTRYYTDANGQRQSERYLTQEPSYTFSESIPFEFNSWRTESDIRTIIKSFSNKKTVCLIDFTPAFQFGDEATKDDYHAKKKQYYAANRDRDVYQDQEEKLSLPRFQSKVVVVSDDIQRHAQLLEKWIFWFASLLLLLWPYQLFLSIVRDHKSVTVRKIFSIHNNLSNDEPIAISIPMQSSNSGVNDNNGINNSINNAQIVPSSSADNHVLNTSSVASLELIQINSSSPSLSPRPPINRENNNKPNNNNEQPLPGYSA